MGGMFNELEKSLVKLSSEIMGRVRTVLVVTAHWEEDKFMISSGAHPGMVYDYYGFPPETYKIKYRAPGSPNVAQRVFDLLKEGGMPTGLDPTRGYDHGTFSLMKILCPDEDKPIVQLSVQRNCDPETHVKVGKLLAPLRDEGVLIIGSGLSFHNLRALMSGSLHKESEMFDDWLRATVIDMPPEKRLNSLINWELAPGARYAHPHEDHFIPIMVAAGAAEDDLAKSIYHEDSFMQGAAVTSFQFGEIPSQLAL